MFLAQCLLAPSLQELHAALMPSGDVTFLIGGGRLRSIGGPGIKKSIVKKSRVCEYLLKRVLILDMGSFGAVPWASA